MKLASALLATSLPIAAARFRVLRRAMAFSVSAAAATPARVGVVQMTSVGDVDANYATCSRLVKEEAASGVKCLCFPEVFSFTGSKDGKSVTLDEPFAGPIMQGYCSLAKESGMWLSLGGFQEKGPDDCHQYNNHVMVDDSGSS